MNKLSISVKREISRYRGIEFGLCVLLAWLGLAGIQFDRLLQLDSKVALHYGVVGTVSKVKMDENFSWVSFLSVENLFLRQISIFLGALNFNMTFELSQGPLEYKPKEIQYTQILVGNI